MTEAELDLAFELLEKADRDLVADLGVHGIIRGTVPVPHEPLADLAIDLVEPTRAYDSEGQRIFIAADQMVDCSMHYAGIPTEVATPGEERRVGVFLAFDRQLSDPRTDGNSQEVMFRRDESYKILVLKASVSQIGTHFAIKSGHTVAIASTTDLQPAALTIITAFTLASTLLFDIGALAAIVLRISVIFFNEASVSQVWTHFTIKPGHTVAIALTTELQPAALTRATAFAVASTVVTVVITVTWENDIAVGFILQPVHVDVDAGIIGIGSAGFLAARGHTRNNFLTVNDEERRSAGVTITIAAVSAAGTFEIDHRRRHSRDCVRALALSAETSPIFACRTKTNEINSLSDLRL